jgi:hypothetical protein
MVRETSKDKKKRQQTERNRSAAKELRKLALELGMAKVGRNADLNKDQFQELLDEVKQSSLTAAQELQVEALGTLYVGPSTADEPQPTQTSLPSSSSAVPQLQREGASSSDATAAQTLEAGQPFRLRWKSVLHTYN